MRQGASPVSADILTASH